MLVNDSTRLAIIGPAVKITNPTIHGRRNRKAHRVSERRRSCPSRWKRPGEVAVAAVISVGLALPVSVGQRWAGSASCAVEGLLRRRIGVLERLRRIGAFVQDLVDGVAPGLLEVSAAAG